METILSGASGFAVLYPILDALVHEENSKRAAEIREELNYFLAQSNLKISQLRDQIEANGINYNILIDKLYGTSPAGKANKMKSKLEQNYNDLTRRALRTIRDEQHKQNVTSAERNREAEELEASGLASELKGSGMPSVTTTLSGQNFINVPKGTK